MVYRQYQQLKKDREFLPKIYSLSQPAEGIQANIIEIKGKNFLPAHQRGKAFLGSEELIIEKWSDSLIVVKQPVPVEFGVIGLYVVRKDFLISNSVPFEVKNPRELLILSASQD